MAGHYSLNGKKEMDRFTALNVFRHVAALKSFAEAGRRMGLSPPAVSKNIGELEAHLGVRLINRTTRRVALTEAGGLYLDHVSRILDGLEEAERALGPLQDAPSGVLRVAAPMTVTLTRLSAALPGFLSQYPDLTLDLHLDDRRVDIVRDGYDIAIRGSDHLEDSSLIARKLGSMPHVLCAAPAYFEARGRPEAPEDLGRHNCIQFSLSGHPGIWEFRKGDRQMRISVDGRYKVTSSLAIRDALRAGFGLSLIPRPYVQEDLEKGLLETALDEWATAETQLYAIYPSRRFVAPKLRVFLDFLIEEFNKGHRPPD
jgi:DNA-binding transcriptional LysR family regulator